MAVPLQPESEAPPPGIFELIDVVLAHRRPALLAGIVVAGVLAVALLTRPAVSRIEAVIRLGSDSMINAANVIEATRSSYLRRVALENKRLAAMTLKQRERYINAVKLQNPRGTNIVVLTAVGNNETTDLLLGYMQALTRVIVADVWRPDAVKRSEIVTKIAMEDANITAMRAKREVFVREEEIARKALADSEQHLRTFTNLLSQTQPGTSSEARVAYYLILAEVRQWEVSVIDRRRELADFAARYLDLDNELHKSTAKRDQAKTELDNFYPTSIISDPAVAVYQELPLSWSQVSLVALALGALAALAVVVGLEAVRRYRLRVDARTALESG